MAGGGRWWLVAADSGTWGQLVTDCDWWWQEEAGSGWQWQVVVDGGWWWHTWQAVVGGRWWWQTWPAVAGSGRWWRMVADGSRCWLGVAGAGWWWQAVAGAGRHPTATYSCVCCSVQQSCFQPVTTRMVGPEPATQQRRSKVALLVGPSDVLEGDLQSEHFSPAVPLCAGYAGSPICSLPLPLHRHLP